MNSFFGLGIGIGVSFLIGWLLWTVPAFAVAAEEEPHWGIGLQGNFPLWGGLSIKYTGLGRVSLQAVEHYVQNGDEYSAMVGMQTPVVLARYPWTKVYIAPGVGFRKTKEIQTFHVSQFGKVPDPNQDRIERSVRETTVGGALLFGLEFFLDNIFTGGENSRYGLNIEFGQVDRNAACEDQDGKGRI